MHQSLLNVALAKRHLADAKAVAVLTGAGISKASGLATFREGKNALWRHHRPEELATPEAYLRDPMLVWQWYAHRFETAYQAKPNRAHELLATLEQAKPTFTLVTQNVDNLHARAGSRHLIELHGNITYARCECCSTLQALTPGFTPPPQCVCGSRMRPHVVWFGETLPQQALNAAVQAFLQCDVALIIGTSGVVEPAASLARLAKQERDAFIIEVNPEPTPLSNTADVSICHTAVAGLDQLLKY